MNATNIFYTWTGNVLCLPGLSGQGHWHCGQVVSSQDLQPAFSKPCPSQQRCIQISGSDTGLGPTGTAINAPFFSLGQWFSTYGVWPLWWSNNPLTRVT